MASVLDSWWLGPLVVVVLAIPVFAGTGGASTLQHLTVRIDSVVAHTNEGFTDGHITYKDGAGADVNFDGAAAGAASSFVGKHVGVDAWITKNRIGEMWRPDIIAVNVSS
ncbi:MAG: hypothetical protein ACYDDF_10855 [Thermoplasmatota archaeon]